MSAPRSILVADDNRDWTDSLAAILQGAGYTVHTAYDGREALDTAGRVQPDVVILDIGMPKLTGYEAARVFDRHPSASRPVLIAVTAWGRESDKLRAQVSGFDHHFTKPVDPAALLALLRSLGEKAKPLERRILIVDDNRAWTDSLADLLRFEGHEVRAAYDGEEAVRIAESFAPDAVLLDLRMPRMSGHDAARAFRRQSAGKRPLLIAVSAFDAEAERQAALKAGFDHFLPKPVQLDRLSPLLAEAPG